MCDTITVARSDRVLFAKNSDRDPNEAQVLAWHPRRNYGEGEQLRCTWVTIDQVRETYATLLSRPFWMWGAEIGTNEHGVTIGNEAVFTRQPYAGTGLTGMDLLRLALERAASAREAVDVITTLLELHGQGGGCGHEDRAFTYHNSFAIADGSEAWIVETAGRRWAVEAVSGARTISNVLTIPEFARAHSDMLYTTVAQGRRRRARTESMARGAVSVSDLMRILRDHGDGRSAPHYAWLNGGMSAACMHAGGLVTSSQTTASWVAELTPTGARHWVTGTAAPCTGLFKPVAVDTPLDLGPMPTDRADSHSLWWRHERLHRSVSRDPEALLPLYRWERDEVELSWIEKPPASDEAFARGDALLAGWSDRVAAEAGRSSDVRPPWARYYWHVRDRRAL